MLGRRFYKHPKEYLLNPGQTITSEAINPIFFVRKEKQECDSILKHLEKDVSCKLNLKSVTRTIFVNNFVDSNIRTIDKQAVLNALERVIHNLPYKHKIELSQYCSAQNSRKTLIEQLLIDRLTLWLLENDKETKSIFKKIKDQWINLVYWNSSLSKFALNHQQFEKILEDKLSQNQLALSSQKESLFLTKSDLYDDEGSTLLPSGVNLNLLKDSILAYAFGIHQINQLPARVAVNLKEQVKSNFIRRFLKHDLKIIPKVNYGIDYEIIDDVLNFSGLVKSNLEGKTLVLQITTSRNRILKEIWIHGNTLGSLENQEALIGRPSKENNYEAF